MVTIGTTTCRTFSIKLVFVPGKPFQPSLMKGLPWTNPLAYYDNPSITAVKSFIVQTPGANVIKLFLSVIYGFLYKAREFLRLDLKSVPMTNTLANYDNP